jgi:hypothetical protein
VDAKAFIRAVVLVLCLVLAAPAVIWLVTATSLEVVALASLGVLALLVLGALAFYLQSKFWAWFMGGLAVLLTPGLLKLGAQFIVGDARGAMEAWIYVYVAGAVGGLLLELIRGRGGLEFPTAELPTVPRTAPIGAVTSPQAANGGEAIAALPGPIGPIGPIGAAPPAGADAPLNSPVVTMPSPAVAQSAAFVATEAAPENGTDMTTEQIPERGGRIDIGFFSRVTMGGLAAAATLIVVRVIVGDTLPAHFLASALRLDTLAGAVLVGMIAPALWSGMQTLLESRFSFMKGAMDTAVAAVANAEQAVRAARDAGLSPASPEAPQFIVDAAPLRSPEFIATIAREEDPTEVGKMLLTRINSARIDLGTVQAQQEAQLGQALGSLETAERLLRSALQRLSRG